MHDDRSDEHDRTPDDRPGARPQRSAPTPAEKPRPDTFESEWDEAPNTNTFRIPRT
jgi:hypothetical protein